MFWFARYSSKKPKGVARATLGYEDLDSRVVSSEVIVRVVSIEEQHPDALDPRCDESLVPTPLSPGNFRVTEDERIRSDLLASARSIGMWETVVPLAFTAAGVSAVFTASLGFQVMLGVMGVVLCAVTLAGGRLCRE